MVSGKNITKNEKLKLKREKKKEIIMLLPKKRNGRFSICEQTKYA